MGDNCGIVGENANGMLSGRSNLRDHASFPFNFELDTEVSTDSDNKRTGIIFSA